MVSASTVTFPDLGVKVAAHRHPLFTALQDEWIKLGHVREGTGGFADGTYLIAHPREWDDHAAVTPKIPGKKLKARRALAAYQNLASTILETKKAALFREAPTRRVGAPNAQPATGDGESPLERWWQDMDGKRTHINALMPSWWDLAATFGHVVLYFELPGDEDPETAADQGLPYVRVYTPLDVINWLVDDEGRIISIKVVEAVPADTYTILRPVTQFRVRIIDEVGWKLYDFKSGAAIAQGEHGLGRLPCAYLYGKRRGILSDVGQTVLGDPRNYIDLYNLRSELRELLRNQTFSFINLPLGTGQDAMTVEAAQAMLGQQTGTMNVLFSGQTASVLSGDAANVHAYQEDIKNLTREIYRTAGVPWESDTKGVEATGSLNLKRADLNVRLAAYADECQMAEYLLADLFYRWQYGADSGPQRLLDDEVVIAYPDVFGEEPFDDVLKQVQAAQSVGMPAVFLKELRKALITKFEGMSNLTPAQLEAIATAIDAAPDDPTPAERMQQRMQLMDKAAQAGGKPPAVPPDPAKV